MDNTRRFELDSEHQGLRLDEALEQLAPDLSRARLQKLVRRGQVRLRGKLVTRSNGRVNKGDSIELVGERSPPQPLEVLHADEHLLAINKPSGMLTHPAPGKTALSLAELADAEYGPLPTGAGVQRPGIVHRLDRETSGVILLARSDMAMAELKQQFAQRSVSKRYLALCAGPAPAEPWSVRSALGPDPRGGDRQWVDPPTGGREAHTDFKLLEQLGDLCWVEASPRTGRRHQVRLHLVASGLTLVGDELYQPRHPVAVPPRARVGRLALHAASLVVKHPSHGGRVTLEAPLPRDLQESLDRLR